jgi:hypothetical protein
VKCSEIMALSHRQLEGLVLICVNATVPAVLVWKRHAGEVTSTTAFITSVISLAVLNAVFIAALRSQHKRQGLPRSKGLSATAVGMAAVSLLATALAVRVIPVRNDYLGLAASNIPLNEIRPDQKRLVVELLRRLTANSQDYERALNVAKSHPLSPSLYSPESFGDSATMTRTVEVLQKYATIDFDYGNKQQLAMAEFRKKMATANPEYLKSWDLEREGQNELAASAINHEKDWLSGVDALYDLAAKHADSIRLVNGKLQFADRKVEQDFQNRLQASKALYDKWQEQVQELVKRQEVARKRTVESVP